MRVSGGLVRWRDGAVALLSTLALVHAGAAADVFPLDPEAEAWVQRTLSAMSLEQRAGQLLMPAIPAGASVSSGAAEEFGHMVHDLGVGCFTLRVRSAGDAVGLINALQASSEIPLLINVNFERGTGTFWPEGTLFPHQMSLAATGDPETARAVGEITARESRACGVAWVSVPICDVNINPENPIINIRSYGEDVETVRRFATAFIEGCQSGGVFACAKHFPGHGDTSTDSHLGLAVVDGDRARLDTVEFPPFRAAIDAGVATVMTSHIFFPALMGDEGQIPATTSRHVLTGLLRGEMRFQGLIITDSMSMQGVTDRYSPGEAAVAAVAAGADVILDSPDAGAAHAALVEGVRSGVLPEGRITESAERILRAKAALGLHSGVQIDLETALAALQRPDAVALAREMAQRAITVVRDEQRLLPLDREKVRSLLHVALFDEWRGWNREDLDAMTAGLRQRFGSVSCEIAIRDPSPAVAARFLHPNVTSEEITERLGLSPVRRNAIVEEARAADVTVVTAFIRTASHKGDIDLGEDQVALIHELTESGVPVILVMFGSPYLATATPEVPCIILTYDDSRLMTDALPGALAGEFPLTGRLPVTLPGLAARGEGLQIPAR